MSGTDLGVFLSEQLERNAPAVFKQFLIEHAQELGELLVRSIFSPMSGQLGLEDAQRAVATTGARPPGAVETGRTAHPQPSRREVAASSDDAALIAKVAAELEENPPDLYEVKHKGYRPTVCVVPECQDQNQGYGQLYCCLTHRTVPREQRRTWLNAFIVEAMSQIGLPLKSDDGTPKKSRRSPDAVAEIDDKIRGFILKRGKDGASIADLVAATELPIDYLRMRLNQMRAKRVIRTEGTTKKARYFASKP